MTTAQSEVKGQLGGLWREGAAYRYEAMNAFFEPKTVAILGATDKPGSVGAALLQNLIQRPCGATVFPVNNRRKNVMGIAAYPSVGKCPDPVDLAVITTPAAIVPGLVDECIAANVKALVIITAGFSEMGHEGQAIVDKMMEKVNKSNMRVIGPNCLGIMNPITGLNATFAKTNALPGNTAFITQSGALCTAVLDWSLQAGVGFSRVISIGSMMDVKWGDLIQYLGDDPNTKSIICYMESIGNSREFISAARQVAFQKPIIIIKAGRTDAAAAAAISHTGTLAGSDAVVDAAFSRCGVLRIDNISDIFDMAEVLSKQPLPKGNRFTILTNAGGPGVLSTDALVQHGGELAKISEETFKQLNAILPQAWSRANPVDILGDATPARYAQSLGLALSDPNSDGAMVLLTPQMMTDAKDVAESLVPFAKGATKPIMTSFMGGVSVEEGVEVLKKAGIPNYSYPDQACRAFCQMYQYQKILDDTYETPRHVESGDICEAARKAKEIFDNVLAQGRTILSETEAKGVLKLFGIPVAESIIGKTAEEAGEIAEKMGFPVVIKIHSETITHKADVGGVILNVKTRRDVEESFRLIQSRVAAKDFLGVSVQPFIQLDKSYELILGSSLDAQFGPVILFGLGGTLVEVFKDRALGLPPLNTTLAHRMLEKTKIFTALKGVRGRQSCDIQALERLMVNFSNVIASNPRIKELDINPLVANENVLMALDARIVLHPATVTDENLPKTAIRTYPMEYVAPVTVEAMNGKQCTIRPVRGDDEEAVLNFYKSLPDEAMKGRFGEGWQYFKEHMSHKDLARICNVDYGKDLPFVMESEGRVIGAARLTRIHGVNNQGIVVVVTGTRGTGRYLLEHAINAAKKEGMTLLNAEIDQTNDKAIRLFERYGFQKTKTIPGYHLYELHL